jgi:hypothetical protein
MHGTIAEEQISVHAVVPILRLLYPLNRWWIPASVKCIGQRCI